MVESMILDWIEWQKHFNLSNTCLRHAFIGPGWFREKTVVAFYLLVLLEMHFNNGIKYSGHVCLLFSTCFLFLCYSFMLEYERRREKKQGREMGEGAAVELDCVNIQFHILRVDWEAFYPCWGCGMKQKKPIKNKEYTQKNTRI